MAELSGTMFDTHLQSNFIKTIITSEFPHVDITSYFNDDVEIHNFFGRSYYSFDWLQVYDMEVNSSIDMDVVTMDTNGDISDPIILLKESGEVFGFYPHEVILTGRFDKDGTELPTLYV